MIHPLKVVAILGAFALLCLGVILLLPRPTFAQDIPPCVDADQFVADMTKDGAEEVAVLELESRHADKFRFVEFEGILFILPTNRGCLMTRPLPLDYAKSRGEPA